MRASRSVTLQQRDRPKIADADIVNGGPHARSAARFQADGCFRTSASACMRIESAGVFAVAALFSSEGAMPFNFAALFWLMCDLSALLITFCNSAIRPAGRAFDLDNWST